MDTPGTSPEPPTPPGQTIVIERRERGGWFRRLVVPILLIVFLLYLFGGLIARESGVPTRLMERYVAGEISGPKIAVVEVEGVILDDEVEHALRQIRQARDDDMVKAVVLRIDSPGGTVSGADRIWRELATLKARKKPVVASMGGLAASGGYYIAAPADKILAEPMTLTGSIGVLLELPQLKGLMEKIGVDVATITTGEWKDAGSPFRPITPEERTRWHEVIDDAYDRFVRVIAQGRNLPLEEVKRVANGKVYTAQEAVTYKLVNELGYLDDAILQAQRLARLETAHVIRYARQSPLESLLGLSARKPPLQLDAESILRLQTPQILYLCLIYT
ncbi:MAG: signal peptide peptidase SppA, partial [Isosphaeraceae bacterium]|nr:signal peptide peptidase SppA [Isosphaeraceae bacterium]